LSGIDAAGRMANLPLGDTELYLTAMPLSLLAENNNFQRRKGPGLSLCGIVLGGLKAIKDGAPTRGAWEKQIAEEALNQPESRRVWRINLRSLSMQMVNTSVNGAAGYAARPRVDGKPGHPVAFTRAAFADVMQLSGDQGATALLKQRRDAVAYLDTDESGALTDIDTPADLVAAERAWHACATCATSDKATSRGDLPKP